MVNASAALSDESCSGSLSLPAFVVLLVAPIAAMFFFIGLIVAWMCARGTNKKIENGTDARVKVLYKLPHRETLHLYSDCGQLKAALKEPVPLPICDTCFKRKL